MKGESGCIFCRIVRGDAPSFRVLEDERTLAFMDIAPPHGPKKRVVHAIQVGDPAHLHYTYDMDNGAVAQIWKGDFLNVARLTNGLRLLLDAHNYALDAVVKCEEFAVEIPLLLEAGMSLEEYEHFVYGACKLYDEDPTQSWLNVRKAQQSIVDLLNSREKIHYKGDGTDITFSTKGRTWINSDGKTNMPSGEVYTSPVEDSVNGVVHFTYPALYMGHEVEGVTLWVKDGYIEKWEARRGMEVLDSVFQIEGTRRFGEVAIGTNYSINRFTKNILFDEKIGGTVHMAIGLGYPDSGSLNKSSVHWDMICDMRQDSAIHVDGELFYKDGQFVA